MKSYVATPVLFALFDVADYRRSGAGGLRLIHTWSAARQITRHRYCYEEEGTSSNYCRLDFEGARLRSDGWSRFKPYTSMRFNPDYSRVVIVTRFNVETPGEQAAVLYVNYRTVGYYDELVGYTASATSERVEFQVAEHNDEVLVAEVTPGIPHVSPRAAIAWMNLRLADPKTSDVERAHMKDALEQLNKLLPQVRPATPPPGM